MKRWLSYLIFLFFLPILSYAAQPQNTEAASPYASKKVADKKAPTEGIAKVVWVQGEMKAIGADKATRMLRRQSEVYRSDTLVTDGKSKGQLVFTDNSLLTLDANTKFQINSYQFSQKSNDQPNFASNLITGGFRTITGLIAKKAPERYEIKTPVATLGVRGTDYGAYVPCQNGKCQTYTIQYKGVTTVKTGSGQIDVSMNKPYSKVSSADEAPVFVDKKPIYFKNQLKIQSITYADVGAKKPAKGGSAGGDGFCITDAPN